MFFAYIWVALPGMVAGRFVMPMIFTPCFTTSWFGTVPSTLPPISAAMSTMTLPGFMDFTISSVTSFGAGRPGMSAVVMTCLLYTSDAADDLLCVDLGGRRIIKK